MKTKYFNLLTPVKLLLSTAFICTAAFGAEEEKGGDDQPPLKKLRTEITAENFDHEQFRNNLTEQLNAIKRGSNFDDEIIACAEQALSPVTACDVMDVLLNLKYNSPIFKILDNNFKYIDIIISHSIINNNSKLFDMAFSRKQQLTAEHLELIIQQENLGILEDYLNWNDQHINMIHHINYGQLSLLGLAVNLNSEKCVSFLLNQPDINVNSHQNLAHSYFPFIKENWTKEYEYMTIGRTRSNVLNIAISNQNVNITKMLLNHPNINPNIRLSQSINAYTPLHLAIAVGNIDIVNALLNHPKIELDVVTAEHLTPFHCAALKGNPKIMELMLPHMERMNIRQTTMNGHDAYTLSNKREIIKLLSAATNEWFVLKDVEPARQFRKYIENMHSEEAMRMIYNQRIDSHYILNLSLPPARYDPNNTLAHNIFFDVIKHNNIDVLESIKDRHGTTFNPNFFDPESGLTPLMHAAQHGQLETLKILLEFERIKVNLQCRDLGKTALMYAIEYAHTNQNYTTLEALLKSRHQIDFSIRDDVELRALDLASYDFQDSTATKLLLDYGANPNTCENDMSLLSLLQLSNQVSLMRLMLFHPTNPANLEFLADYSDNPEIIALMHQYKNQVNRLKFLSYLSATDNTTPKVQTQSILNSTDLVRYVAEYL